MTEVISENYDIYKTPVRQRPSWTFDYVPSNQEKIITHCTSKTLPPSRFMHGCICGHNVEIRDLIYDHRKRNLRCPGITIRPKVAPISLKFRS